MNEDIKTLAIKISELLKENYNPYVKIEIDTEGTKMTSVDYYEPTEVDESN